VAAANRFEAQAPVALEWAADKSVCDSYEWKLSEGEPFEIDFAGLVGGLCDDRRRGVDVPTMAARAHNTIAGFLAAGARRARELTGLSSVALSGGCFANRLLTARLRANLVRDGFEVLTHRLLPVGDGGVCVGQAVVAAGRWCAGLADGE
jgi:hydrogenase maturation protein HypF